MSSNNKKCVLYLDEKDIHRSCTPNDCDRLGCKLNSNYNPDEQRNDWNFSKPGKYSIWTIIQILIIALFFVSIFIRYILVNGLTSFIIIVSLFLISVNTAFYYEVIYKSNKYWNNKYNKIKNEIEKRLSMDNKKTLL